MSQETIRMDKFAVLNASCVRERTSDKKRWGVEQRLSFIDYVGYWEGAINRSRLMEQFGISAPQASSDLMTYQQIAPLNLRYDLSSKRYKSSPEFACVLISPDADTYLSAALNTQNSLSTDWEGGPLYSPPVDVIPVPARRVDPDLLREVLAAMRVGASVEIEYNSMNEASPDSFWRRVTPHAFVLSRCRGARDIGTPGATSAEDDLWNSYIDVVLIANPALQEGHKRAIEYDYAMNGGTTTLSIRYALLYYFDKRLQTDIAIQNRTGALGDPRQTPVVVSNYGEYLDALKKAGVREGRS
jgi:hypothetical protein